MARKERIDKITKHLNLHKEEGQTKKRKVYEESRQAAKKQIKEDLGDVLHLTPFTVITPISPKQGDRVQTEKAVNDALAWLDNEEGIDSVSVYRLVKKSSNLDRPTPLYLSFTRVNDKKKMIQARKDKKWAELEEQLTSNTGLQPGEIGIGVNDLLVDID